jgi:hypothetical protein
MAAGGWGAGALYGIMLNLVNLMVLLLLVLRRQANRRNRRILAIGARVRLGPQPFAAGLIGYY